MMADSAGFDMLIAIINEHMPSGKDGVVRFHQEEVKGIIDVVKSSPKPLLAVVSDKSTSTENHGYWRWTDLSDVRARLMQARIPVYPTTARAARAASKAIAYWRNRDRRAMV